MPLMCHNNDGKEAQVGVMVYGPEGGTTDLCPDCFANFCLDIAQGAYGPLGPPGWSPETAETAAAEVDAAQEATRPKRRRSRKAQAQEEAESEPAEITPLPGADDGGRDPGLEPGA